MLGSVSLGDKRRLRSELSQERVVRGLLEEKRERERERERERRDESASQCACHRALAGQP